MIQSKSDVLKNDRLDFQSTSYSFPMRTLFKPIIHLTFLAALAAPFPNVVHAEMAFVPGAEQGKLISSSDSLLEANKRLVFDFWREVFEGGHMELAERYLSDEYIQHNPNVQSGRRAFVDFFSKIKKPQTILPSIQAPLISMVAERDLVILTFGREYPDPKDATQRYMTTWFDMFRIRDGKIVEHWDPALRR